MKRSPVLLAASTAAVFCMIVLAACAKSSPGTTPTSAQSSAAGSSTTATQVVTGTTATAKPQNGGTISLIYVTEPVFDLLQLGKARPHLLSHEYLWDGDWTRGPAGGYGTKEFSWTESTYIPQDNVGVLAEKVTWSVNAEKQDVTITVAVRQGVHYALNPDSEASRLVNGREMTADDVLFCMNAFNTDPNSQDYALFPMTRDIKAVKTGPWEVKVTYPFKLFLAATMRQIGLAVIFPPEVYQKYGKAFNDIKNDVGTGPYIITDYVQGSMVSLKKNPNYWMKDPIGPGKGGQLPYIDNVKYYILTDASTREAALRTAKVDQLGGFNPDDADQMKSTAPDLVSAPAATWSEPPAYMRTDLAPFNDVKVRRALMMATDFNTINKTLYRGLGQILSWPTWKAAGYEDLYLGLDDPECPDSVRELYSYNPSKAKQLLQEAGYPNGFKTSIILTQDNVDYYSMVKDQWSKVNIDLALDVREAGSITTIAFNRSYKALFALFYAPNSTWPEQANYTNIDNWVNASMVNDPYVNEMAEKAQTAAVTDFKGAMKITKELMKYLLDQAYCIPTPRYPQTNMWWPWLKNYSGETSVGYFPGDSWVKYIWIDQGLKKQMGH